MGKVLIDGECFKAERFIYVHHRQRHGQCRCPNRFIFQVPGHLVDATVAEGMSRDGVTALDGQRLAQDEVVVRTICSTAADLKMRERKSITT